MSLQNQVLKSEERLAEYAAIHRQKKKILERDPILRGKCGTRPTTDGINQCAERPTRTKWIVMM